MKNHLRTLVRYQTLKKVTRESLFGTFKHVKFPMIYIQFLKLLLFVLKPLIIVQTVKQVFK